MVVTVVMLVRDGAEWRDWGDGDANTEITTTTFVSLTSLN